MKAIQLYFIVFFLLRTIFLVQSCIECSKQVRDELKRYRKKVLPKKVKNSAIRERCDLVIESMETDFFKNYALNHYSGYMESREAERHIEKVLLTMPKVFEFSGSDEEYLDNIVNYRWNILNELKPSLKKAQDKGNTFSFIS
ncbi:hypothetical protein GDO86_012588 [Hymenochirus boettgeri]|uniref:Uncharacterized protein n=1 Tax=Hymenochirus boettgeri TaxID=247094 RepID=A0A8T2IVS2_9PIPI|nr:hypothetical protein GDO86_012588 [Hymenochirus boettgeri]